MNDNLDEDAIIEALILEGAVEPAGMSEDGEMLYSFSPDLKEVSPGLYDHVTQHFYSVVTSLWEKGILEITADEDDFMVTFAEGFDEDSLESLDLTKEQQQVVSNMINIFKNN
jgi:hypothetical protein